MPWSPDFVDMVHRPVLRPHYLLESIAIGEGPSDGAVVRLSSHWTGDLGAGYAAVLTPQGSTFRHARLQPNRWSRTHLSFSVGMLGIATARRRDLVRGQVLQLRIGFDGWDLAQFQRVALGVVRDVRFAGGQWVIDCSDLVGSLTSRFVNGTATGPLFTGLDSTTSVGTYTAGVSTTLQVTDGSGFEESSASGGEGYLLLVTPTVGDAFYLHATTRTVNVFSGITEDVYGTTTINAIGGSVVQEVAFTEDHPITVALRVLASTGAATNGRPDFLPERWGYGIPIDLIDLDDADAFVSLIDSAGASHDWTVIESASIDNGLSWLESFLSPGGFFVGQHQGSICVRGVPLCTTMTTPDTLTITDDDIVDIGGYSTYSPDVPIETGLYVVNARGTLANLYIDFETTATRPTLATNIARDIADSWVNTSDWADEIGDRLGPYAARIPEQIRITCRGWRCGAVSPGDVVRLSSEFLFSRTGEAGDQYDGRPCLVIGGGPDFFGATTRLELLALPILSSG